ncbi:MAG: helix-turn-helix transcriptional regulator [Alphaproteobacteria bacterium]|nr:helix-turn-helix transcriptional regulator [Alphaproteobacteria bacterium]
MTTKEVAEYLRIKERKVYDLVRGRRIPCTRVTGKWLFPKALIDLWVLEGSDGPVAGEPPVPRVVAGSHDPLLEWALRESSSTLAILPGGSLDGLGRLARREAMVAALHVLDAESGDYNVPMVRAALDRQPIVVIEWAGRQQGLIVARGKAKGAADLSAATQTGMRVIPRQKGAGSQILLEHLLVREGIDPARLDWTDTPARTETDVGLAIQEGLADVGLGLAAVAAQYQLDFVPLHRERLDLVMTRHDYFEPEIQALFDFAHSKAFRTRASSLKGYGVGGLGRVHYNGP